MKLAAREFFKRFIEAGVVPKHVRRMIIDVNTDSAVMVHYECFGDDEMLQLITPASLATAEIKSVKK